MSAEATAEQAISGRLSDSLSLVTAELAAAVAGPERTNCSPSDMMS